MPWENGIRVTLGKHSRKIGPGIWAKIPIIHRIYSQPIRMRVIDTPIQTVTSKSGETITIRMSIGYSIEDIVKLFNTVHQPVETISNIALGESARMIATSDLVVTDEIATVVGDKLKKSDYGLCFKYVMVTTFAKVRTYRLIGDQNWSASDGEGITIQK